MPLHFISALSCVLYMLFCFAGDAGAKGDKGDKGEDGVGIKGSPGAPGAPGKATFLSLLEHVAAERECLQSSLLATEVKFKSSLKYCVGINKILLLLSRFCFFLKMMKQH